MLKNIIDNKTTDKNTIHSYLETYEKLFVEKKDTATDILEIGVLNGGSMKLWSDYFKNANIDGMDICFENLKVKNINRVKLIKTDAYDKKNIPNKKYDIIIDDGPHTFVSIVKFLFYYIPLLKDDGVAIIEDIQYIEWCDILNLVIMEHYPELKDCVRIYDLRINKKRYDDILYVIDKRNLKNISI